jgi:hypothetical protein
MSPAGIFLQIPKQIFISNVADSEYFGVILAARNSLKSGEKKKSAYF